MATQTLKATFVQGGSDGIDYTPAATSATGDVIDLGDFVGVARGPIGAGTLGTLDLLGVYKFVKEIGAAISFGDFVLWDSTAQVAFVSGGGYTEAARIGKCVKNAGAADPTVLVFMGPGI